MGVLWLLIRTSPCCSKLPNSGQGETVCATVEQGIATGWSVPVVAVEPHTVGDARLGVEELHINLCIGRSHRLSSMNARRSTPTVLLLSHTLSITLLHARLCSRQGIWTPWKKVPIQWRTFKVACVVSIVLIRVPHIKRSDAARC